MLKLSSYKSDRRKKRTGNHDIDQSTINFY